MSKRLFLALSGVALLALTTPAWAAGQNGTTLAAVKTLDICAVSDSIWRYSGEVSVWNEGAVDTQGLSIVDNIQNKVGAAAFTNRYTPSLDPQPTEIPNGTTQLTATVFKYSVEGVPLEGDIRNSAKITIMNHSGSLGKPKGPEPKSTWAGGVPKACDEASGCTYSQGYWGNKPNVTWPSPYLRTDAFYLSGKTWQGVMDTQPAGGNGYYILAYQFAAATLNFANGASLPGDVADILDDANTWFTSSTPTTCSANGSCGTQKAWGGILKTYNEGSYPQGPKHCGVE